jgi:hypothetical protein
MYIVPGQSWTGGATTYQDLAISPASLGFHTGVALPGSRSTRARSPRSLGRWQMTCCWLPSRWGPTSPAICRTHSTSGSTKTALTRTAYRGRTARRAEGVPLISIRLNSAVPTRVRPGLETSDQTTCHGVTALEAVGGPPHCLPGSRSVWVPGARLVRRFSNVGTISLGTGLSCFADTVFAAQSLLALSVSGRYRPPQTVPSGTQGARPTDDHDRRNTVKPVLTATPLMASSRRDQLLSRSFRAGVNLRMPRSDTVRVAPG